MASPTKRPSVLVRMSPHQKDVLEREARKHGRSMNDVICEFIDWLDRLPEGHKFVITPVVGVTPPSEPIAPHIEGQTTIPVEEKE